MDATLTLATTMVSSAAESLPLLSKLTTSWCDLPRRLTPFTSTSRSSTQMLPSCSATPPGTSSSTRHSDSFEALCSELVENINPHA